MPNAVSITSALLSASMQDTVNDEYNQYKRDGFVYSPISYVLRSWQASDYSQKRGLLRVLESYGGIEVYYHETGPQPSGYKNAPPELHQREQALQDRLRVTAQSEENHRTSLRRMQEHEAEKRRLTTSSHELMLAQNSERARQQWQIRENEQRQIEQFTNNQHRAELQNQRQVDGQRLLTVEQNNRLQLEYKKKTASEERRTIDARVSAEERMLELARAGREEQGSASQRQYNLQSKLLDRQKSVLQAQKQLEARQKLLLTSEDEPD